MSGKYTATDEKAMSFKQAISLSKGFFDKVIGKEKEKEKKKSDVDGEKTPGHFYYKRRMRIVSTEERHENPLNLGENGWGAQSWENIKRDQRGETASR